MKLSRGLFAAAFVGAVAATVGTANAVTLDELLTGAPDAMIVQGDRIYSKFTYLGTTIPASAITITTPESGSGLRFTANPTWSTATGPNLTSVIGYTLSTNPGSGATISGVGLAFDATASGGGAAFVGETVYIGNSTRSLQIFTDGDGGLQDQLTDSITLDPAVTSLRVIKSIDVTAGSAGGSASIQFVDNTFVESGGENPPVIPEPATLALLPLALAGLALRRRAAR